MKRGDVLREELQIVPAWDLGDDTLTLSAQLAPQASMGLSVPVQGRRHAQRDQDEGDGDECRDEIAHGPLCYQTVSEPDLSLVRAYGTCLRIVRAHYENFPVASWLLPAGMRPHVAAVYAFARYADDFADEGERQADERLALLHDWQTRLGNAVRGDEETGATSGSESDDERDQVFVAVADTIRRHQLPVSLFEDLLSAFRQDVTVNRYQSWSDLLDYSRRSANPVGRLVLRLAGYRDERLDTASDSVCSALQLTNFLQDLVVDWRRDRLYVPREVYEAHGADADGLGGNTLPDTWRAVVEEMVGRIRSMFDDGRPVCDAMRGRLGLELRLTWLGGRRILDRLELSRYDPFVSRPTLGLSDGLPIFWKAATWRRLS